MNEVPDDEAATCLVGGSPVRSNVRARRFAPRRRLDRGCPSMKESATHAFVPSETGVSREPWSLLLLSRPPCARGGAREGVQWVGWVRRPARLVGLFLGAWRLGEGRLVGRAAQQTLWELRVVAVGVVGVVIGLGLACRLLLERVGLYTHSSLQGQQQLLRRGRRGHEARARRVLGRPSCCAWPISWMGCLDS